MKITHHSHWHRGLHAIHFGFMSGLIVAAFMATVIFTALSPAWVKQADAAVSPFTAASFWNTPVPAYTSLHSDSGDLVAQVSTQVSQFGSSLDNTTTSSIYEVSADTPLVKVEPWDCGLGIPPGLADQWQQVPIPFYAVPSSGPNGSMVIHQPSTGTVWEFGHMRNVLGQWQACTGGRISTGSEGIFPSPYGISASGLAVLGGLVKADELRSGYIDHVIGLALPQTNGYTSPATQASGSVNGAPAQGMRLRLDPSVNINALGLNSAGLAIARAAQTYGFVVWNTAGSVSVPAENPITKTARGIPNPYENIPIAGALHNFPWDKLQVLPSGSNYAAIVPAITSFSASKSTVKADSVVTLSWQSANVNRCAISGVGDNLPANGSIVTKALKIDTTFVLRCGGPAGAASSQVHVKVSPIGSNDPLQSLEPGIIVDQPYSGYANVIPELMSAEAAERVYKVVYYENNTYLFETAKRPFALNTSRMDNGKHVVDAQIYYRDGTSERKTIGLSVSNTPETLFATIQSGVINAPPSIPLVYAVVGGIITIVCMAIGSWWGWRKAHLA